MKEEAPPEQLSLAPKPTSPASFSLQAAAFRRWSQFQEIFFSGDLSMGLPRGKLVPFSSPCFFFLVGQSPPTDTDSFLFPGSFLPKRYSPPLRQAALFL